MADPARPTEGARLLREYLQTHGLSVPAFAAAHGLDRVTLQRMLRGERWRRVPVDMADAVQRATHGAVPWTSWRSSTAAPTAESAAPEDAGEDLIEIPPVPRKEQP